MNQSEYDELFKIARELAYQLYGKIRNSDEDDFDAWRAWEDWVKFLADLRTKLK